MSFPPDTIPEIEDDQSDMVNHPAHYGGADNPYEAIKVINAWELNFNLGSAVKYIARAGKKDPSKELEDLKKAAFYINYQVTLLERETNASV